MNFGQFANMAAQKAQAHQECTECFDPLCNHPVGVLCDAQGKRICAHVFHKHCLDVTTTPNLCPLCSKHYAKTVVLPKATESPEAWFRAIDVDSNGSLSYEEIIDGLKAQVKLEWNKIEMDVDRLFTKWDRDRNGSISLSEFTDPVNGVLPYLKANFTPHEAVKQTPSIAQDKGGWFRFWDEDHTGSLDKSEVSRALIKTLRTQNIDRTAIVSVVDCLWPIFDTDGSGSVDYNEFIARDGLADTIIAQLSF